MPRSSRKTRKKNKKAASVRLTWERAKNRDVSTEILEESFIEESVPEDNIHEEGFSQERITEAGQEEYNQEEGFLQEDILQEDIQSKDFPQEENTEEVIEAKDSPQVDIEEDIPQKEEILEEDFVSQEEINSEHGIISSDAYVRLNEESVPEENIHEKGSGQEEDNQEDGTREGHTEEVIEAKDFSQEGNTEEDILEEDFTQEILEEDFPSQEEINLKAYDNSEPGIISSDEYDSINKHELEYERVPKPENPITGMRIVELGYVLDWATNLQYDHSKICTLGRLSVKEERRKGKGLTSTIIYKCSACEREYQYETENPNKKKSVVNTGAVWGTIASGSTYSHTSELLSCMDIPTMSQKMFYNIENKLGQEWESSLLRSMKRNGETEKEIAIQKKQVCTDGTPWITVYVDGSWSKRSYGTNFNSLSGMVAIIGKNTGHVLFIAIRNKFCIICARAANRNNVAKNHNCYKNWDKSAPAMEADMVVEGFNSSQEMHGVKYLKFIADGDSSVHKNIIEKVGYGNDVRKIECTNHVLKNYGKRLREIKKDTRIKLEGRKMLTLNKIKLLTKRAKTSIYEHAKQEKPNVNLLRTDLRNGLHHVYGNHISCRPDICNSVGDVTNNMIPLLKSTSIFNHLSGALNLLTRKSHLLIENQNNNAAERLMNVVSRFNEGKRLNLVQRGSYQRRVHLSGLRYNAGAQWHTSPYKNVTGCSPGKHFKKYLEQQASIHENKNCRKRLFSHNSDEPSDETPSKKKKTHTENVDYGPNAEQPENTEVMKLEVNELLQRLRVTEIERDQIQLESIGQFGNDIYESERQLRLTASLFGNVMKRKNHTPCHCLVKTILKKNYCMTEAMEYGILKEKVAKGIFEDKLNVKVLESGLWVDIQNGYLGASPDGLLGEDAILEIKCLHSASKLDLPINKIDEVIDKLKNKICLEKRNNTIQLKRNHNYYYQIQGQLNITRREKCYFVVYISDNIDLYIEEIHKDVKLWNEIMLPKLQTFYINCVAPEIIRNRIGKGQKCIDPAYIRQAILEYEAKKKKKAVAPMAYDNN